MLYSYLVQRKKEPMNKEKVWDEILDLLIKLKVKELITEKEYKVMKEDFELIVNDIRI